MKGRRAVAGPAVVVAAVAEAALMNQPRLRPRPGRPRADSDPAQRTRHLAAAHDRLVGGLGAKVAARRHNVCRSTLYNWLDRVVGYDEAPAELRMRARSLPRGAN